MEATTAGCNSIDVGTPQWSKYGLPSPVVSSDPPLPAISEARAPLQWTLCWIAMKQKEQACHFSKRRWKNSLEDNPRGGRRSTMGIGSQVSRELGTCAAACS